MHFYCILLLFAAQPDVFLLVFEELPKILCNSRNSKKWFIVVCHFSVMGYGECSAEFCHGDIRAIPLTL